MDIEETVYGMRIDTFLADCETLSEEDTQNYTTIKEQKFIEERLMAVLNYPRLYDALSDEISIEEKMKRVNKYLYFLHRKSKIIKESEKLRKLELEYCHFLGEKRYLLYRYIEKLKLSNEQYSKEFTEDKIRELEEEREYIQRLVRVKEETLEPDLFY